MRILGRLLCLLAALAVLEGPHLALQAYAWCTMVSERAPVLGFEEAVAETLSGQRPCEKCLALEKEREKKSEQAPVPETRQHCELAPVVFASASLAPVLPTRRSLPWREEVTLYRSRTDEVPSPPPRRA